jgi:hypothetical protein
MGNGQLKVKNEKLRIEKVDPTYNAAPRDIGLLRSHCGLFGCAGKSASGQESAAHSPINCSAQVRPSARISRKRPGLLDVQRLAPQWQDGLVHPVAAAFVFFSFFTFNF